MHAPILLIASHDKYLPDQLALCLLQSNAHSFFLCCGVGCCWLLCKPHASLQNCTSSFCVVMWRSKGCSQASMSKSGFTTLAACALVTACVVLHSYCMEWPNAQVSPPWASLPVRTTNPFIYNTHCATLLSLSLQPEVCLCVLLLFSLLFMSITNPSAYTATLQSLHPPPFPPECIPTPSPWLAPRT